MNQDRPLFKGGNTALGRAVNWALDRRAILNQAGYLAGIRDDADPAAGNARLQGLPLLPDQRHAGTLAKAKALAKGHTGDGKAILWSRQHCLAVLQAQIMQYNLKQIGLDVDVQTYARGVQIEKEQTRGAAFDFTAELGADYADPYDFIDILLNGENIHEANNNNLAYLNVPALNKQMDAANALVGDSRYAAYRSSTRRSPRSTHPGRRTRTQHP